MDRWNIEKLKKSMRLSKTQSNRLKNQSKRQSTRLEKGFSSSAGWGRKTPPPDPPISINPANQQNKGFGRIKISPKFRTFFADFCIEFDGFSAIFLWFFIGFQRILHEV